MQDRYINPFVDYGFKKLFGTEENKDLLISFLNAIIFDREGVITNVTYKNIEQLGDSRDRRNCYFDVYCETQDGSDFIVEMQNARKTYFKDRSLFYAAKPIRDQAEMIYLEMPKLKDMPPRTDSFRDLWLYALQTLCYTDEYPEVLHQGIFKKLYDAAALANMNDAQLLTYERSQKVL